MGYKTAYNRGYRSPYVTSIVSESTPVDPVTYLNISQVFYSQPYILLAW